LQHKLKLVNSLLKYGRPSHHSWNGLNTV